MTVQVRELTEDDADALREFFAAVPAEDRTFFKDDVTDPGAGRRWVEDRRSVGRLAVDDDGAMLAFAALTPGVERTSHVADLRLVVAAQARGQGLGRAVARHMLLEAVRAGFRKVTVDVAAENTRAIQMFRGMGFVPEALLRDQLCDPDGRLHDLVVLAHGVDETWAAMATAGIGEDLG